MSSTTIIVSVALGLLVAQFVLWGAFLRIGLRWAKAERVTARRVAAATLLVFVLQTPIGIGSLLLSLANVAQGIVTDLAIAGLGVLAACWVISRVFGTRPLRSLQAWLPTLIPAVAMLLVVVFVLRPFVVEAFTSPSNGMAPTLLGRHVQGVCAECGQPAFGSPIPRQFGVAAPPLLICGAGFHVAPGNEIGDRELPPDRFLVAKFVKPRRWDVVVFRYPEDPSVLYVMRLVGLPGEEIRVKDGDVWADGRRLTPPYSLQGVKYTSEIPGFPVELWGTPERPAKLGAGEYFVLGDFSANSKDSRLWEQGSPGHPPFAVPESHLYGVVTHVFWPPQRWRILR